MLRATSPRKSETHRPALVSDLSHFPPASWTQNTAFPAPFIFLSGISSLSALLGQGCLRPTDTAPPSLSPGRALASMTANPLHHLSLIRAQWRMISLHIKALKQLNKLAPSQSPAQELALNSEALPMGAPELAMKAGEPHAEAHRRSSVSQEEKWMPAVSHPYCASASLSPWLSTSELSLGCSLKFMCSWLSVIWWQIINPWVTQALC